MKHKTDYLQVPTWPGSLLPLSSFSASFFLTHWPPSLNMLAFQDLCICLFLYLECSFPRYSHGFFSHCNQISGQICPPQAFPDYLPCLLSTLHHHLSPWRQGHCLPCSLLYPQQQEECPANNWCPIKNGWMNKWVSECRTLKQGKDLAKWRTDGVAGCLQGRVKEKRKCTWYIHKLSVSIPWHQGSLFYNLGSFILPSS